MIREFLKRIKENEGKISALLAVVIIALVGYQLFTYFKSTNITLRPQTTSTSTEDSTGNTDEQTNDQGTTTVAGGEYEIRSGDSLWKIAQATYGSGYEWTKIYDANKENIKNPSLLHAGTKINLPKMEQKQTETVAYKVVKGDNLWNISAKLCNNGFAYTQIAAQNNISNPSVIEIDQELKVMCPTPGAPLANLPANSPQPQK